MSLGLPIAESREEAAIRIAHEAYGLRVTASALPSEYDYNFRLTADDGREFALKFMRADYSEALLDLQLSALDHLAELGLSGQLQQVCRTLDGGRMTRVTLADGTTRLVWLLTFLPGRVLAGVLPRSTELLRSLGELLGRIDAALASFTHPAARRELKWDLAHAEWIRDFLPSIGDPARRTLVTRILDGYAADVVPALASLRTSVIYGDANDHNVLINPPNAWPRLVVGVIDFGDMHHSQTVCDLAIAAAYALLDTDDALESAAQVVAGYHQAYPLTEAEIALIFPLICTRLAVSVTNSAQRAASEPDDPYITVSEAPAWAALERLAAIHPRFAQYVFRHACGLAPVASSERVVAWLREHTPTFAPVLDYDLRTASSLVFDLSVGSLLLGADPRNVERATFEVTLAEQLRAAGATVGVGRYDEARLIYDAPAFATGQQPSDERRTIHLGIDLFVAAGEAVYAPLAGTVACLANNAARLDYGPLVILEHATDDGQPFYTLYGHMHDDVLSGLVIGQRLARGERIGSIGAPPLNGDWPPHLHFQLIIDLLDLDRDFPGVARASQREIWRSLSPDPNVMLGLPVTLFPAPEPTPAETLALRRARIGRNLSISYRQPLKIVRGWMQHLYDETGRAYLDAYNNVAHVGHSHPRVVRAAQAQLALLNTNTRYLHDAILRYAERLTTLLPAPLSVCFFVNSASEANELALRLARAYTGQRDMIVLDAAYHGHTTTLVDISPYKFNGPGGTGAQDWVHSAPIPDDYRGPYKRDDPAAGTKYAAHVATIIDTLRAGGRALASFIAESLPSVGGQIVLPSGYLADVYGYVRAAGGLCIADEVQVGFGRLGTHFWGFELQAVVPDIVVLGKPIGNGFPLGAVVTTPAIAAAFDNGMEFFSTFGGNPVACAAGLAVLDIIQEEQLQSHALHVGAHMLAGLRELLPRHPIIGDVRGAGLFLGVELVRDRTTLTPAAEEASYIVNRLRERGILAGTDGPYHNVIKIRPPMPFTITDADFLVATLDAVLGEDFVAQCA